jgi:hypothetical protein
LLAGLEHRDECKSWSYEADLFRLIENPRMATGIITSLLELLSTSKIMSSPNFCQSIVNVGSVNEPEHFHGLNDCDILNGEKFSDENILKLSEKLLT